ncbi:hypothetical protein BABINDRAFT_5174 [Babjeviella inositovora NRRL Y-12698]|uniref:Phosphatidylinositol-specific phospholipase C X domain-containing protein n=1 Tax=Babjeviella inositovora NRRL Y-12698 TaxID=984486 RepID=A0A1E3QWU7_9ASCO|nr:uncharacterized protein BABINDRAFT_5174 [Babjeviella inositovora NRRL Y-12698]ODQ82169.1 hypothetical protein BABINDRAFT_5174 [Babjeviella inositovora NRRL Y-12698]
MVQYNEWMKDVNDDAKLSSLSVPGTHNSAACHVALPSVQCQGASVTDQLNHGVRFLDIRCAKLFLASGDDANDLQVIHGKFPVKIPFPLKLAKVLDEVYAFLQSHGSETVIVSLKQEGQDTWDNDSDEFPKVIWENYVRPHQDQWYLGSGIPRLGDTRGKAVLFRRFGVKDEQLSQNLGIDAHWWTYNTTDDDRGEIRVQDFCELNDTNDVQKKSDYVKQLTSQAIQYNATNPADPKLFLNFCSGSNFFNPECWPEKIAQCMSDANIQDCFGKGCGIVVLDYSEKDDYKLVKELVDKNF